MCCPLRAGSLIVRMLDDMKRNYEEGRLPATAPLANPYVPFQLEDPPRYSAEKGLIRGTLYPGLDLPFMGMVNTKEKKVNAMMQLQALGFAIQELALYLDTHRNDMEALELYREYQKIYNEKMNLYSKDHGPLNHSTITEGEYSWLNDPWPWEYCGNKEA